MAKNMDNKDKEAMNEAAEKSKAKITAYDLIRISAENSEWNRDAERKYKEARGAYEENLKEHNDSLAAIEEWDKAYNEVTRALVPIHEHRDKWLAEISELKLSGLIDIKSRDIYEAEVISMVNAGATNIQDGSTLRKLADLITYSKNDSAHRPKVVPMTAKEPKEPKLKPIPTQEEIDALMPTQVKACDLQGLIHPVVDPSFVVNSSTKALLDSVAMDARIGVAPNILLTGPAGCGKTELAQQYAARNGMPMLKINVPLVREPRDWFGYKTLVDGQIVWIKSLFAQAIEHGGVVVLLDEITRAPANVLNSLMPLLDGNRATYIEEVGEVLHMGPGVVVFATANIGLEYSGSFRMDKALADRFGVIVETTYLEEAKEAQLLEARTGVSGDVAKRLAKFAASIRSQAASNGSLVSSGVSTRTMIDAARMWTRIGVSALNFTILPQFSAEGGSQSPRAAAMTALQSQFGAELASVSD